MNDARVDFCDVFVGSLGFPEKTRHMKVYSDLLVASLRLFVRADRKTFVYLSVFGGGRVRTLGDFPAMQVAQARARAQYFNEKDVAAGRSVMTFAECFRKSMARKSEFTSKNHVDLRRRIELSVLDTRVNEFLDKVLEDIAERDIAELIAAICAGHTPFLARQCRRRLRRMFDWAIREKSFTPAGGNPMANMTDASLGLVAKPRDILTKAELAVYASASDRLPLARERALAKCALLSGCQPRDLARMRWSELDLEGGSWTSPRCWEPPRIFLVTVAMCRVLTGLRSSVPDDREDDYVFGVDGRRFDRFRGFKASIDRLIDQVVQEAAPSTPVRRLHFWDLRRTLKAFLIEQGLDEQMISVAFGAQAPNITPYRVEKIRAALDQYADGFAALNAADVRGKL